MEFFVLTNLVRGERYVFFKLPTHCGVNFQLLFCVTDSSVQSVCVASWLWPFCIILYRSNLSEALLPGFLGLPLLDLNDGRRILHNLHLQLQHRQLAETGHAETTKLEHLQHGKKRKICRTPTIICQLRVAPPLPTFFFHLKCFHAFE